MTHRPLRRARHAALAAALLASAAAAAQLPATLRQTSTTVYSQCSAAEKAHLAGVMSSCAGCLSSGCPDSCCMEKPAAGQYVICEVPAAGATSAGCCVRVMGTAAVELAAAETVAASGKDASGVCLPAPAETATECPATVCAVVGTGGVQSDCASGGVQVPNPDTPYVGPPLCADGTPVDESAEAATATTTPPQAATTATPEAAPATPATSAPPASPAAAGGSLAPVEGPVPPGCTKTFPGFRCQGAVGYPEVKYRGGCCLGECALDPAKGWGYWCPEMVGQEKAAAAAVDTPAVTPAATPAASTPAPATPATTAAPATTAVPATTIASATTGAPATTDALASTAAAAASAAVSSPIPATEVPVTTAVVPTTVATVAATTKVVTTAAPAVVTTAAPAVVTTGASKEGAAAKNNSATVGTEGASKCFHPSNVVQLESGESKRMADVAVGDMVQVGGGAFSEVYMWTHKDATADSLFLNLTSRSGHSVVVTPGHYIFVHRGLADASDVSVGDRLVLGDGSLSEVESIDVFHDVGLYNPQTLQGDIVVNGVKASTYTRAVAPSVAHTLLAPLRLAYTTFGFSSQAGELGAPPGVVAMLPQGPSHVLH